LLKNPDLRQWRAHREDAAHPERLQGRHAAGRDGAADDHADLDRALGAQAVDHQFGALRVHVTTGSGVAALVLWNGRDGIVRGRAPRAP
jgi:hypothetical protein